MTFPQFLESKYLEWQKNEGGRRTVAEFSDWLGFPQSTISTWWSKENIKPKDEQVLRKLSTKLGIEVYDVLGIPRPDPDLLYLTQNWGRFDSSFRKTLREQAEKYAAQNKKKK